VADITSARRLGGFLAGRTRRQDCGCDHVQLAGVLLAQHYRQVRQGHPPPACHPGPGVCEVMTGAVFLPSLQERAPGGSGQVPWRAGSASGWPQGGQDVAQAGVCTVLRLSGYVASPDEAGWGKLDYFAGAISIPCCHRAGCRFDDTVELPACGEPA
jgi:hypothetical protein